MNLKLAKNIVKKKLDKDSEFKKYYNSLDEKEKAELKRILLSHDELKKCILEAYVYEPSLRENIQNLFQNEILAQGYKSVYSKKAKRYAGKKIFCFKIENKHLVAVKFFPTKKSFNFSVMTLTEIHSPKGKLYVRPEHPYTIITGHFFDRYAERLDIKGDRDDIVFAYLSKHWGESKGTAIDSLRNVTTLIGDGLGLGVLVYDIIFLKTYISKKLVNDSQDNLRRSMNKKLNLAA